MRWCRVRADGDSFFGRVQDERVIRIDGTPLSEFKERKESFGFEEIEWLPPIVPPTFYAVGFNYRAHIEEAIKRGGGKAKIPERPEVGYRSNNALIGHNARIIKPVDCEGRFELEAEAVAVIGKKLRNCGPDEARAGIFGWTIGNDVSAREWQHNDRTFYRAKNSDTFKPMGPWIETDAGMSGATTTVSVNDDVVAEFDTGDVVFNEIDYIVEIARYCTLWPGDVIWMGADGASGIAPGDSIAITISGIGTLRNEVVDAADAR